MHEERCQENERDHSFIHFPRSSLVFQGVNHLSLYVVALAWDIRPCAEKNLCVHSKRAGMNFLGCECLPTRAQIIFAAPRDACIHAANYQKVKNENLSRKNNESGCKTSVHRIISWLSSDKLLPRSIHRTFEAGDFLPYFSLTKREALTDYGRKSCFGLAQLSLQ